MRLFIKYDIGLLEGLKGFFILFFWIFFFSQSHCGAEKSEPVNNPKLNRKKP